MEDRTVLGVVDECRVSLISRLRGADAPPEILATVSAALLDLRSQVEPFDSRREVDAETVAHLGRRLRAVEHRLDEALAKATGARWAVEAARRAVWEFICHIGQDLRSPLTAVLNLTDILSYEELTAEQRAIVADIIRTGEEVFGLVDDTLVLSRLEAGMLPLSVVPVAPADVVDDACHIVKPLADDHGVRVTVETGDPDVRMRADRHRLARSLAAVIGFAVTSSRPGGEVRLGWAADQHGVTVWIRDTGHGFAPETLTGLFDPVGWSSDTSSGSTRLRLVLARRLVEAMRGTIDVASAPGRGSRFALRLGRDATATG